MKKFLNDYLPDLRCTLIADRPCVHCVLDFSVRQGKFVKAELKGDLTVIDVSTEFVSALTEYLKSRGISCKRKRGYLYGYRKRIGILVGALLFVFLIGYFSSILWSVDVVGISRLTEHEVKALLRECGVYEGIRLKAVDNDLVRIKMMSMSKDIAWISVNIKGMRAEVVVAEAERAPEKEKESEFSNIVAACDGIITGIVIERGQQMVKIGETVKKGELLVSGVIEERDGEVSLVNASARVYAQTEKEISVVQPYQFDEISLNEGKIERISLETFGKSINFSLNYGLSGEECDIIHKRGSVYLFGSFRLPISYVAEYGTERVVSSVSLTQDDARRVAEEEAYRVLFSQSDAELISRRFSYDYGLYKLTVRLYAVCEENIALGAPFTAEP